MSVRGIGWYVAAFVTLIVAASFIGVAAASFFASLTPLYVSIVCSVAAVVFGIVAAVRARPGGVAEAGDVTASTDAPRSADAEEAADDTERADAAEPIEAAAPADATPPSETE